MPTMNVGMLTVSVSILTRRWFDFSNHFDVSISTPCAPVLRRCSQLWRKRLARDLGGGDPDIHKCSTAKTE